jgi:hypothetical protein
VSYQSYSVNLISRCPVGQMQLRVQKMTRTQDLCLVGKLYRTPPPPPIHRVVCLSFRRVISRPAVKGGGGGWNVKHISSIKLRAFARNVEVPFVFSGRWIFYSVAVLSVPAFFQVTLVLTVAYLYNSSLYILYNKYRHRKEFSLVFQLDMCFTEIYILMHRYLLERDYWICGK